MVSSDHIKLLSKFRLHGSGDNNEVNKSEEFDGKHYFVGSFCFTGGSGGCMIPSPARSASHAIPGGTVNSLQDGHLVLVLAVSQSFYYDETLYKTDTPIRWSTDTLKSSTDTCEVLKVTTNYNFGKKNPLITKYVTLCNTRRLIDSSYLVGRIHTIQFGCHLQIKF